MFVETVDKLVVEFQQRLGTMVTIPWGWVFTKLTTLLARYPSGITKAILLSELECSWRKVEKFQSKGTIHGTESLRTIALTQQLSQEGILEVFLQKVEMVGGTHTQIGVIQENTSADCFTMQMYLHKKLYDKVNDIMENNFKLRFTGCRLFHGRSNKSTVLLPSDNFVVLVYQESTERFFGSFPSLEGFDQYTMSQYIDSVKVKVVEIGKIKSLHYQNGQTVNQITVIVVDDLGIQAKFILWEEYLLMAKLFEEGDTLFIKKCFLVPDPGECYLLEYGPETVIFCSQLGHEQKLVPSQGDPSKSLYVTKDNKGKLDYSMYPEQLTVREVKADMTNMTLFGQVIHVQPRKLVKGTGVPLVTYQIKIHDGTGECTILVTDKLKGGTVVYVKQFVLMKNLSVSRNNSTGFMLQLDNEKGGSIWNVSSLEGWLTTSSICSITPLHSLDKNCGHCVTKGTITDIKSRDGNGLIVQVHSSCNTSLEEDMQGKLNCSKCNVSGMVEMPEKSGPKLFSLNSFWEWKYDICIMITDSIDHSILVTATNEVAEKLLQLSARQCHCLQENPKERVFEFSLGQECYFGISSYNNELLIGAVSQT